MTESSGFKQWCIVELFGHQVTAGMVSEQQIGGQAFVRVDVPAVDGRDGYTKLYGSGAIYAMTPTDEVTCRKATLSMTQPPVELWRFRPTVPGHPMLGHPDDDDYLDDEDHQ